MDFLKYFDEDLYVLNLEGPHQYIFRKIPYGEYKKIKQGAVLGQLKETDLEDLIFTRYVISASNVDIKLINELPAGIVTVVAQVIMQLSDPGTYPDMYGNVDVHEFQRRIDYARMLTQQRIDDKMFTVICSAFKGYKFNDLEKLPFDEVVRLFTAAENYLLEIGAYKDYVQFVSDQKEEEPKENKKEIKSEQIEIDPVVEDIALRAVKQKQTTMVQNGRMKIPVEELDPFDTSGKQWTEEEMEKSFQALGIPDVEDYAPYDELNLVPAGYDIYKAIQKKEKSNISKEKQRKLEDELPKDRPVTLKDLKRAKRKLKE